MYIHICTQLCWRYILCISAAISCNFLHAGPRLCLQSLELGAGSLEEELADASLLDENLHQFADALVFLPLLIEVLSQWRPSLDPGPL